MSHDSLESNPDVCIYLSPMRTVSFLRVASDVDGRSALELRIATTDVCVDDGYIVGFRRAVDIYSESMSRHPVKRYTPLGTSAVAYRNYSFPIPALNDLNAGAETAHMGCEFVSARGTSRGALMRVKAFASFVYERGRMRLARTFGLMLVINLCGYELDSIAPETRGREGRKRFASRTQGVHKARLHSSPRHPEAAPLARSASDLVGENGAFRRMASIAPLGGSMCDDCQITCERFCRLRRVCTASVPLLLWPTSSITDRTVSSALWDPRLESWSAGAHCVDGAFSHWLDSIAAARGIWRHAKGESSIFADMTYRYE
ncbi:hypothetical protein BJ912DRAFT_1049735 [Pholiota molesta]|nr:hypothetical protein BJ912DRAFT_1049735 [Pholiota molesta]